MITNPAASDLPPKTDLDSGGLGGQPRGLTTLFFAEMWERFSYYGMRAVLVYFMTAEIAKGGLGYAKQDATAIFGTYTMSVYLLCILGGFIADNFIGSRVAVLWGGIVIASGHFSMAFNSEQTFYLGLVLIAIGTGLLKPNISTMVGGLYSPTDERRDAGFSIFYMGINMGALFGPLVVGWLAQDNWFRSQLAAAGMDPGSSWHFGFAAAGVGMILGLVVYLKQRERLATVGNAPAAAQRPWGKLGIVILGSAALIGFMMLIDKPTWDNLARFFQTRGMAAVADWINTHPNLNRYIVYFLIAVQIGAVLFFAFKKDVESKRMAAILIFFMAAEIFWAVFEQAGSTVALFGDELTHNYIFGWNFPSSWYQSVNSLWVILLAPVIAWVWIRLGSKQPSSPFKFVLGLFFLSLSFILMIPASQLTAAGKVSPLWIIGLFFLQTVGELCLSPVGLSTMTKLAPARLVGLVMGIWFLGAALGNKFAGVLAGHFESKDSALLVPFFWNQALAVIVCAGILLALVPWMKRLMGGVK